MKRFLSFLLCAAMALSCAACGKDGTIFANSQNAMSKTSGVEAGAVAMGRWTETDVTPLVKNHSISAPVQLTDGTLWCFATEIVEEEGKAITTKLHQFISKDDGASWQEEANDWSEKTAGAIGLVQTSPNGTSIFGTYSENAPKLWIVLPGGEPEELILPGFSPEHPIAQQYFITDDIVYIATGQSMDADGKMIEQKSALFRLSTKEKVADVAPTPESDFSGVGGTLFGVASDGKQLFNMMFTQSGRTLYALQQDGTSKQLLQNASTSKNGTAAAADTDGNYYFASETGISRIASGGTLVENILDGSTFSLALPDNYANGLCRTNAGDFMVAINVMTQDADGKTTGGSKLYRYHFDMTLPAQSTDGINVWSLADSPTIRAAIVAFNQEYPDIAVNYTPVQSGDNYTLKTEDALRTLNTELLAGSGPDVLLMDGIDVIPYIQKGMLADLAGTFDKAEMMSNITAPYTKDKVVSVMPARFSVPVLYGDVGTVENLTTLDAVQAAVLAAAPRPDVNMNDGGYYDPIAEKDRYAFAFLSDWHLMEFVLETSAPAILKDNTIDTENLRKLFTFYKAVSDYYGLAHYRTDDLQFNGIGIGSNLSDTVNILDGGVEFMQTGHAKYGYGRMETTALAQQTPRFADEKFLPSTMMMRPGLVEGAYLPGTLLAVSAASKKQADALHFVQTVLGETVQDGYAGDGIPVRQSSFDKMCKRNESKKDKFEGDVSALVKSLKTPVIIDDTLEAVLDAHAKKLTMGDETIDEAVAGVQNDLAIYLAERQ